MVQTAFDEMEAVLASGADAMNGLFDRLDRDKSGTISYHELKKLVAAKELKSSHFVDA